MMTELHVTPLAYRELLDADLAESAKTEGAQSSGSGMRSVLLRHLPRKVIDTLPNPVKVVVVSNLPLPFMVRATL